MTCPACQATVATNERFCGHCGHAMGRSAPPSKGSGKALTIGANPDCDVIIGAASVSGAHCRISRAGQPGRFLLEDLGSTNGTFVDGQRIQRQEIGLGTAVQLGLHPVPVRQLAQKLLPKNHTPTITDKTLTVGRANTCDLVLPYPMISSTHLEVRSIDGILEVRDLNSSNGSFVSLQRLPPKTWKSLDNESLHLGSFRVPPATLGAWRDRLEASTSVLKAQKADATIPPNGQLLIGRDPNCDVVIDAPQISWQHARIIVQGNQWTIEDLKSSNGVYVNGSQVKKGQIHPSDQVFLGTIQLNLDKGRIAAPRQHQGEIRLDAMELTRELDSGTVILDKVGVSIYPGELVALMGPSGAGKTTLLEMLTGQQRPTRGSVLVNGVDLHDNLGALGERIGYVPQEDIMHRDLTVFEVLYRSAIQRLPRDLPDQAVVDHVEKLLVRMSLDKIRDSVIGGEAVRGISGGQRKRVNIAIELITEPPLLFLDEPTSGLDSTSTLEVMMVLRSLADTGKTIIATVHQPRIEAFERFDQLLLLTKGGKLAFYGPANPDAGAYFEGKTTMPRRPGGNPADFVIDALDPIEPRHRRQPAEWQADYLRSRFHKDYVTQRRGDSKAVIITPPKQMTSSRRRGGAQVANLFERYKTRKMRDESSLMIQIGQPVLIGGLIGMLFKGDSIAGQGPVNVALFLLATSAFWLGCSNVARELVADRPVYIRERRSGLSPSAYLQSIFTYQMGLAAAQALILLLLSWPLLDVDSGNFLATYAVLLCTAAAGVSVGLFVSAASKNEVMAISWVPILLLPQLMFSGFLLRYLTMSSGQQSITQFVPLRWSFEAIARLEFNAVHNTNGAQILTESIGFPAAGSQAGPMFLLAWTALFLFLALSKLKATS